MRAYHVLAMGLLGGIAGEAAAQKVYWVDHTNILFPDLVQSDPDGSNPQTLFTLGDQCVGFDLDVENGEVYWTTLNDGEVRRANLDGSGETLLIAGLSSPSELHLDPDEGMFYYLDNGTILRANMNGSGAQAVVLGESVKSFALHHLHDKLYWAGNGKLKRADQDGSSVEELASGSALDSMELDTGGGKVYFLDSAGLYRANLDGSAVETLDSGSSTPFAMEYDPLDRQLYLSALSNPGAVGMMDVDTLVIDPILGGPFLYGGPVYTCASSLPAAPALSFNPPVAGVGTTVDVEICGGVPGGIFGLFIAPPFPTTPVLITNFDSVGVWQVSFTVNNNMPTGIPIPFNVFSVTAAGPIIVSPTATVTFF